MKDLIRDVTKAFGPLTMPGAEANRSDPYDALDTIQRTVVDELDELDRDESDTIMRQVHALRAYITGMEHG